jgi:hypothetical protein
LCGGQNQYENKTTAFAGRRAGNDDFVVGLSSCACGFADLGETLGEKLLEIYDGLGEALDALFQLIVGYAVGGVRLVERKRLRKNGREPRQSARMGM